MTTTPDSFSAADLESLFENAVREEDITAEIDTEDCSQEYIINLACKALEDLEEKLSSKQACLIEKVILSLITDRMIEWHSTVSVRLNDENEDTIGSLGWARDAGKFQAIANILSTIQVTDDDFTAVNL